MTSVRGYCPSCGGNDLAVMYPDTIMCRNPDCQVPEAAALLLQEARETEHVVVFHSNGGWTAKHPLIERVGDQLMGCWVNDFMGQTFQSSKNPAGLQGRYRLTDSGDESAGPARYRWDYLGPE